MEGMHAVGDIFTKIRVNCVINYMLHYDLCVYFYGFILCVDYNCLFIYGYCLSMLHVYDIFISICIFLFKFYI
jgi:hypothetical protein